MREGEYEDNVKRDGGTSLFKGKGLSCLFDLNGGEMKSEGMLKGAGA